MAEKTIFCPLCKQELSIDEQYIGMEVECPCCSRNFITEVPETAQQAQPVENNVENQGAHLLNKFKNAAANIGTAAARSASNINNKLNEMQAAEKDIDGLEFEAKIDRIKKGIPARKIFAIAASCVLAIPMISLLVVHSSVIAGIFLVTMIAVAVIWGGIAILVSRKRQTNQKTSGNQISTPLERKRKILAAFFSEIAEANNMANQVMNAAENVSGDFRETAKGFAAVIAFFIRKKATANVVVNDIYKIFKDIRKQDLEHINQLDVLPRFGKSASQLVADDHTLYSPLIVGDGKYKFDDNGEFIYAKEELTKIYTFEDQLLIFTALWDYTTGELYNERSEAFFFKDITDISTTNNYEIIKTVNLVTPPPPELKPFPVKAYWISFAIYAIIWFIILIINREAGQNLDDCTNISILLGLISLPIIIFILWPLIYDLKNLKKITPVEVENIKRVRASETFSITSTSGRSIGMTMLCNGWFEANNGKFEERTDGEKIIHAIRKMIEEKKVIANE